MIKDFRSFRISRAGTSLSLGDGLRLPGALGENVLVFKEPRETIIVNPATDLQPASTITRDLVKQFLTQFETHMFSGDGITPEFLSCVSLGIELVMLRIDASPNAELLETPPNADTLLLPAADSIFKSEQLLRNEDPALLREENLDQVHLARELIDGYQGMLDIIDPLQWGSTARKVQAQWVLDGFCRRVGKYGRSAIMRNRILTRAMDPLIKFIDQPVVAALATKQVKAQVAHEVEATTLSRVKEVLDAQGASTGTVPESTGTVSLKGAHAPGQKPVPPGAMPVMPVHPKPKRRPPAAGPSGKSGHKKN